MQVELITVTPNPEDLILRAASICYKKEPDTFDKTKFLPRLISMGHLSVFEHPCATFLIQGISRACSHQLVRHRIASFTQMSQRYVEQENDVANYVYPETIHKAGLSDEYMDMIAKAQNLYQHMIQTGIPREDARYILPNSTFTSLYVTMNFRELMHFFELRLDKHAQWEIREMAKNMFNLIQPVGPNTFKWKETWN